MNKVAKQFVIGCVLLATLPALALSLDDCKELPDCEAQACEVQYKLNIVKRQYKQKEIDQLTLELEEITEFCESDKLRSVFIGEIDDIYKEMHLNKIKLEEALKEGRTDSAKKYQTKIDEDKMTIEKMSTRLGQMKTSSH